MMKNREFRELQVSSTQLAIIFLGILIIGVIIFLLGVSVGKKHAQVAQKSNLVVQQQPGEVKEKITIPETKPLPEAEKASSGQIPAPIEKPKEEPKAALKTEPSRETPKKAESRPVAKVSESAPPAQSNPYYVQVGALQDKPAALSTAQKFKAQGYPVVVLDPFPTDRRPVFRVRIGGFKTREEAESARTKLASAAGRKVDYFIVRD